MDHDRLSGVVTPILTPFTPQGRIATDLFCDHARNCLSGGSHYLAPFGTTGEATSIAMADRMTAVEDLVKSDAARADQLMPGTGLTSLSDTMTLTRHAAELGVAAVLILPPFFYKTSNDDGLYRYYAQLIEGLGADCPKIILYHIPQISGVGISPALTHKLALDFPGVIAGYKDSSGQWKNTTQILRAAPGISVFPASEAMLQQALASGGAGCISATCNVNVAEIRKLYDLLRDGQHVEAKELALDVDHVRGVVEKHGVIGGSKSVMAARTGNPEWLRCLPPLPHAPAELSPALEAVANRQNSEISAR